MTEATVEQATPIEVRRLDRKDVCDRCGYQGFVIAIFPGGGELVFCNHHGTEYKALLESQCIAVKFHPEQINAQPSPSANAE